MGKPCTLHVWQFSKVLKNGYRRPYRELGPVYHDFNLLANSTFIAEVSNQQSDFLGQYQTSERCHT
eukprot:12736789-Ditylum_brightwellii.AAC.1